MLKIDPSAIHASTPNAAEGYRIYSEKNNLVMASPSAASVLYGACAVLRRVQTGELLVGWAVRSAPRIRCRLLNHWDNPNGTVEGGYAGSSIWKWDELPQRLDPRCTDYARANASIGLNGVVVNNVNASARYLTPEYLPKVGALAGVMRPYGIRVYLSVFWAAPKVLGGLPTADPLAPAVQRWWAAKTDEIYRAIPDFGGFLVKASSEGEPGPQNYQRTHAGGANMLAKALGRHDGVLMWRAFVCKADGSGDRFKEAYQDFQPLDGQFDPQVLVQVKNGPIDFQAREPFHPLFGAMPRPPLVPEGQLTQEYLGLTTNAAAVRSIAALLGQSRSICVRYTTPLGLHHITGESTHYGPQPWLAKAGRPDWTAVYYQRADSVGLGFDRTAAGSNALVLYRPAVQKAWGTAATCPLDYLLWFHHVGWRQPLNTGRTLWNELCYRYYTGADSVAWLQRQWAAARPALDAAVYADVAGRLQIQQQEAHWWRDACVRYFQTLARQPVPGPFAPPTRTLADIKRQVQVYQLK